MFEAKTTYRVTWQIDIDADSPEEAGARTECAACRACSGTAGRGHSNITIIAHGAQARAFKEAAA